MSAALTPNWPPTDPPLVEVDRANRRTRRSKGKSHPIDAIAVARATVAGTAVGTPKTRTGPVEAIRAQRVARQGAAQVDAGRANTVPGGQVPSGD